MTAQRFAIAAIALVLGAASCTHRTGTPSPSPSRSGSGEPPTVDLLAQNVELLPGAAQALRIGFAPADPTVRLIATFPDIGAVVGACALASVGDRVPSGIDQPGCLNDLAAGVRENLSNGGSLGGVALWLRSGPAIRVRLQLEYTERSRDVEIRMPLVRAPASPAACRDNACNPFFEMTPVRGGEFRSRATWTGGAARLALLEGRIVARSLTATGVPYGIPAEQSGPPPATLVTHVTAPAEYAVVLDRNASDLTGIDIVAHWP